MLISTNSGLFSARVNQPRFAPEEAMAFFQTTGFEAVDYNFSASIYEEPFLHDNTLDGNDWRTRVLEIRECMQAHGLEISHSHTPFRFRYDDKNAPNYGLCHTMMLRSLEATALLGGVYAVIHPMSSHDREHTLIRESIEALKPYGEYAAKFGVVLAVENMFSTYPEELMEIAEALDCAVCWDSGHGNMRGVGQRQALLTIAPRLRTLHLHDNYGLLGPSMDHNNQSDKHQPPLFGNIDWQELTDTLKEIGYPGTFNYEVTATSLPVALREAHARYLVKAAKLFLGRESQTEWSGL